MKRNLLKKVVIESIVAAIYVVLVFSLQFMSFDAIQFRIAEALLVLVYFSPNHIVGLLVGTILSNLFSSLGVIDLLFGTIASLIALVLMLLVKKQKYVGLIIPGIINGIIISIEIAIIDGIAMFSPLFWLNSLYIFLGETAVMYLIGVPLILVIKKNKKLQSLISLDYDEQDSSSLIS